MPISKVQVPSIVLPQVWATGAEVETVADLLEHTSIDIDVRYLQEKMVHIQATEIVGVGAPGALWCWIELAPYGLNGAVIPAYYAAIAGGGGALPPVAPFIEVGVAVNGTIHTIILPWAIYSPFARVVVQTPVNAGLPNDFWQVQVMISGKS